MESVSGLWDLHKQKISLYSVKWILNEVMAFGVCVGREISGSYEKIISIILKAHLSIVFLRKLSE